MTKDDGLTKEVEKFIQQQNEEQFNVLVMRLRKDLYKQNMNLEDKDDFGLWKKALGKT